jgi:hypothetical protein
MRYSGDGANASTPVTAPVITFTAPSSHSFAAVDWRCSVG